MERDDSRGPETSKTGLETEDSFNHELNSAWSVETGVRTSRSNTKSST